MSGSGMPKRSKGLRLSYWSRDKPAKARRKRDRYGRHEQQVPTLGASIERIMSSPKFALGVADVRAGRSFPANYDKSRITYCRTSAALLVSPVRSSMPDGTSASPDGKTNPNARRLHDVDLVYRPRGVAKPPEAATRQCERLTGLFHATAMEYFRFDASDPFAFARAMCHILAALIRWLSLIGESS